MNVGDQEAVAKYLPIAVQARACCGSGCARRRRRSASRRGRRYSPSGVSTRTATRSVCCVTPTTLFASAAPPAAARRQRSTRNCSTQYCWRLMNAGMPVAGLGQQVEAGRPPRRERTRVRRSSARLSAPCRSPQPRRSKISSVRLDQQIAREPDAHRVVVVEHQHVDAALRQIDRRGEADRVRRRRRSPANVAARRRDRRA